LSPNAQAKFLRVISGKIFDVILDLRKNSPTFGKWESFELSSPASSADKDNFQMLFVPRGFAHGFVTLEKNTEITYKVNNFYAPQSDSGIIWNDPDLNIKWPIKNPIISERDKNNPTLRQLFPEKFR